MKKLTLTLVLALCGARTYGQLPQDVAVNTEQIQALNATLETAMQDPKNIDAACQELGLPKEEVKSWFARHKVLTGAGYLLGVYATLLALSYCGKSATWRQDGTVSTLAGNFVNDNNMQATTMIKLRNALCRLSFLQVPVKFAAAQVESVWDDYVKDNKKPILIAVGTLLVVAAIAWDLYRGKDSAIATGLNKLFVKKEVVPATSEVVAEPVAQPTTEEEVAKAEVPATTEVAPVV